MRIHLWSQFSSMRADGQAKLRPGSRFYVFALPLLALALIPSCTDITSLAQENPGVLSAGDLYQPANAQLLVNGAIVAHEKDINGKGGIKDLYTLKPFNNDFHLKLEFRASLKSDSGVYIRGPQLQVRDFIRRNEHMHLKDVFKNDDWNTLEITVNAGKIATTVNGKLLRPTDALEITRLYEAFVTAREGEATYL